MEGIEIIDPASPGQVRFDSDGLPIPYLNPDNSDNTELPTPYKKLSKKDKIAIQKEAREVASIFAGGAKLTRISPKFAGEDLSIAGEGMQRYYRGTGSPMPLNVNDMLSKASKFKGNVDDRVGIYISQIQTDMVDNEKTDAAYLSKPTSTHWDSTRDTESGGYNTLLNSFAYSLSFRAKKQGDNIIINYRIRIYDRFNFDANKNEKTDHLSKLGDIKPTAESLPKLTAAGLYDPNTGLLDDGSFQLLTDDPDGDGQYAKPFDITGSSQVYSKMVDYKASEGENTGNVSGGTTAPTSPPRPSFEE